MPWQPEFCMKPFVLKEFRRGPCQDDNYMKFHHGSKLDPYRILGSIKITFFGSWEDDFANCERTDGWRTHWITVLGFGACSLQSCIPGCQVNNNTHHNVAGSVHGPFRTDGYQCPQIQGCKFIFVFVGWFYICPFIEFIGCTRYAKNVLCTCKSPHIDGVNKIK